MLATGLASLICSTALVPLGETTSGGRIAFYSNRDGNYEIYSVNSDGTDVKRLTNHDADDQCPTWSPNGGQIAFVSKRSGNSDVYIMDADGGSLRQLTTSKSPEHHPAFSPDGSLIAFASERDGNSDIYIVDADGGNERRLTTRPESDGFPQFSPDGKTILFGSRRDDRYALFVMNADGSDARLLLASDTYDIVFGRWSPDGKRIAFFAFDRATLTAGIHLIDADGTNEVALTDGIGRDEDPAWSPDGKEIVFHALHRDDNWDIYIIDVETRAVRRLIDHSAREYWPHWSPVTED